MSKSRRGQSKRSRRPSGHPASVARRRERDRPRRSEAAGGPPQIARRIAGEAAELPSALEAELWASHLLGAFWSNRRDLPLQEAVPGNWELSYGEPLVAALEEVGGAGAAIALGAIAEVNDGALGERAGAAAARVRERLDGALPAWLGDLGGAEVTGAAVVSELVFDDAADVFLEVRYPGGETLALGVLIDHNLGGLAKDMLIADSIDAVEAALATRAADDGEQLRIERAEPGVVAGRIHEAIELTDMTLDPPVGDEFADLRALALLFADAAPEYVVPPGREELAERDRDLLVEEFLASPEAEGFAPDGDEAFVASLAIDFCAGYVDGRPLRWSPVVVELFMADWVPRKVVADAETLECLPHALDAWVRFAGRRRGIPEWAIERTREAIPRWQEEMHARAGDPAAAGPAKQFLEAAGQAGLDLEDREAVEAFIAGWNARSGPPE